MMNNIELSWTEHCKHRYPREFGNPERFKQKVSDYVWNYTDLLRYVHKYNGLKNCYVSVYSFQNPQDYNTALFDTIYIDLDDEEHPEKAIEEGLKLIGALYDQDIIPRFYFSGKKGIAIYLDFIPVDIAPENMKPLISKFIDTIEKRLGLSTLDHCTKDAQSRISRIPNTKHMDTGLFCIPLTYGELEEGLDHIKELARCPREDVRIEAHTDNELPLILKEYEAVVIKEKERADLIRQSEEIKRKLGLGFKHHKGGEIKKCKGVLHAEQGQKHPGREPTSIGLILAYSNWYDYPKEEIKTIMREWAAHKCTPPREWGIIEARIEKFYKYEGYTPCTFLMKYGHCEGAKCPVMRSKIGEEAST